MTLNEGRCSRRVFHTKSCVIVLGDFEGYLDAPQIIEFAQKIGATYTRDGIVYYVVNFKNLGSGIHAGIEAFSEGVLHDLVDSHLVA